VEPALLAVRFSGGLPALLEPALSLAERQEQLAEPSSATKKTDVDEMIKARSVFR
jgi:hypothetical protein